MNKVVIPGAPVPDADFAGNTSSSIVLDQRLPKTEVDKDCKERHQRNDGFREDWQAAGND